jgi:hypothetical protein
MMNKVFFLDNKRSGRTAGRDAEAGLAIRGCFISIFSGLILLVTTFHILENYTISAHLGSIVYAGAALLILFSVIGVYKGFLFYKNYRFRKGAKDTLHLMSLMEACLHRDCGRLGQQVKLKDNTGLSTLHTMLHDKLADILAHDCRNMVDIQKKYRKIGFKKKKKPGFSILFNSPEEYAQRALPPEIDLIAEAVTRNYYQLESEFNALKASRMRLFTVMGDYLMLFPLSEKSLQSILTKYRYKPPGPMKTMRIAFAIKLVAYFENVDGPDPPYEKLKNNLAALAAERLPLISGMIAGYQSAWKDFVDAYDDMKALSKGLDIR